MSLLYFPSFLFSFLSFSGFSPLFLFFFLSSRFSSSFPYSPRTVYGGVPTGRAYEEYNAITGRSEETVVGVNRMQHFWGLYEDQQRLFLGDVCVV